MTQSQLFALTVERGGPFPTLAADGEMLRMFHPQIDLVFTPLRADNANAGDIQKILERN
jgi:hypothetical protein